MSDLETMTAQRRDRAGKGAARATRRAGMVPGVIYGDKKPPLNIALEFRVFYKKLENPSFMATLFDLDIDGEKHRVLPRDVQYDPVTDFPIHVDFLRLGKDTTVTVAVPVTFVNEDDCPGIRVGGVLNIVRHEIEVDCRHDAIPSEIVVDLAGVEVGESIHISAITLPDGVTATITDRDFTIATIAAPVRRLEVEGEAEDGEEEGAEERSGE